MTLLRDMPGDHPVELAHLAAEVQRQLAQIGEVIEWFRPAPTVPVPSGWIICDGATTLTPSQHDFGTGANFTVPDLRGKFILGANIAVADGQAGRAPGDVADPTLVLVGSAPGIGGAGGANTVNVSHTHTVANHTHGISSDGSHTHAVNAHSHPMPHDHDIAMPIAKLTGSGTLSPVPLYLIDPSDSRLDDAPGNTHFWKNATGNKHSIRLDPFAGTSHGTVQDRDTATAFDVYEQTSTGPSNPNTGDATPGTGAAGTHNHGGVTGGTAPATDAQLSTTQENRPAYYGLLHLVKVKWS